MCFYSYSDFVSRLAKASMLKVISMLPKAPDPISYITITVTITIGEKKTKVARESKCMLLFTKSKCLQDNILKYV
jgi:hypothetical protein